MAVVVASAEAKDTAAKQMAAAMSEAAAGLNLQEVEQCRSLSGWFPIYQAVVAVAKEGTAVVADSPFRISHRSSRPRVFSSKNASRALRFQLGTG
jgi:hypothetical protein